MKQATARAYTNIALIKYWGKKDETLILPMNSSLSLTLDAFYTETTVTFDPTLTKDQFFLNGELQGTKATKKIEHFLNLVREKAQQPLFAKVESQNFVPTAAGLASSASGLAALAGAASRAIGLDLTSRELSQLARRGSGSASRSIFGGFVEWEKGEDDATSFAHPVSSDGWEEELAMIFILLNQEQKDVSSRDGMKRTVETSPFYPGWLETTAQDLILAKEAIAAKDFQKLGEVTESNALKMHATTLGANPPFTYWSTDSLRAMEAVRDIRNNGTLCYFTMDAGPNVKVLCQKKDLQTIQQELQLRLPHTPIISAGAGQSLTYLETRGTL